MAKSKTLKNNIALFEKNVLKYPRVTEKAANVTSSNAYVFDVLTTSTKQEVAKAFEAQYKIKPVKVNIVNIKPKKVLRGKTSGFKTKGRKAYIYLPKGKTIEIM